MTHQPGKQTAEGVYEWEYMRKPDDKPKWERFKLAIYNSETHEFLGRTATSWVKIIVFYMVFYTCLSALFAVCMAGMFATLDARVPHWQLDNSLIGTNPGLGFRPIAPDAETGSLIWYEANDPVSTKVWIDRIDGFLEAYLDKSKLPGGGQNQVVCDFDKPPAAGKVCSVPVNTWGECTKEKGYGYNRASPCIFIKVNRVFGWVPEYYNNTENLPNDMPVSLKEHIKSLPPIERNQIWITCNPENPADSETIGELEYHPKGGGLPGYYYPYTNTEGYLSPLVAVRLLRPSLNLIINVECKAWAQNIVYRGGNTYREGSVHVEIMID